MNPKCPKCTEQTIKYGHILGRQRWQCKKCNFQFTRNKPRGKPLVMKLLANLLYMSGMSMNSIAAVFDVSTPSILKWIRKFAEENYEKPEPGNIVVLELDEMWHFIDSKKTKPGFGRLLIEIEADWLIGRLGVATQQH